LACRQSLKAAAEPDPILALIEEYRQAYAQHGAALDAQDDDQSTLACNAQADAAQKLCHTAPTTPAGLAAVLSFVINVTENDDDILRTIAKDEYRYISDFDEDMHTCLWPFLKSILRSAEQMARAQS
jgi:hypothetical protein